MAADDPRVVAGAIVGSLADDRGDRWSDLDLTFAVADAVPLAEVLESWTASLVEELAAIHLFDLPSEPSIYRVLLLPTSLEVDLSFTPASAFAARGPAFRLVFGRAAEPTIPSAPPAEELFGYAVHHALHARACVERGRRWQAEYWISAVRDHALALACRRLGLDGAYGRDFDRLPEEVATSHADALVRSLQADELRRALVRAVAGLLRESADAGATAAAVTTSAARKLSRAIRVRIPPPSSPLPKCGPQNEKPSSPGPVPRSRGAKTSRSAAPPVPREAHATGRTETKS
jgi:hypothetical protein